VLETAVQVEHGREARSADKETRPSSFRAFVEDRLAMLDARLAKTNASSEEDSP
jgi:hypothetical protein